MMTLRPWHALVAINVALVGMLAWSNAQSQPTAPVHDVLQARLIELVNAEGRVVAQLYPGEDGSGQIRLRNGRGEVRVKLGPSNDGSGAGLVMMDRNTEPAVILTSGPEAKLTITP